jgi:phage baseplate assembly protein W
MGPVNSPNIIVRTGRAPAPFKGEPVDHIPDLSKNALGSGLAFGSISNNSFEIASGSNKIKQSLFTILTTPMGCHFGRPDFGSMLPYLLFEAQTALLINDIIFYTKESINKWETRIILVDVTCDFFEDQVIVYLSYQIKGTSVTDYLNVPIYYNPTSNFLNPADIQIGGKQFYLPSSGQ